MCFSADPMIVPSYGMDYESTEAFFKSEYLGGIPQKTELLIVIT